MQEHRECELATEKLSAGSCIGEMKLTILALDTSTEACSVACWRWGEVFAQKYAHLGHGHAEALVPMVASVMAESGLCYDQLDAIAVTIGPGTFTGLRVGLAAARGLALASSKPMIGVTTLEAIAHAAQFDERSVLAVLDARRGQLYAQAFDPMLMPIGPPSALPLQDIQSLRPAGPYVVAGTGAALARPHLLDSTTPEGDVMFDSGDGFPRAVVVARIASAREPLPLTTIRPLYLRAPDVTVPTIAKGGLADA